MEAQVVQSCQLSDCRGTVQAAAMHPVGPSVPRAGWQVELGGPSPEQVEQA